jgi:predicted transcriptional regulator
MKALEIIQIFKGNIKYTREMVYLIKNLTYSELELLFTLMDDTAKQELTQQELAKALNVSRATINRSLKKLQVLGLYTHTKPNKQPSAYKTIVVNNESRKYHHVRIVEAPNAPRTSSALETEIETDIQKYLKSANVDKQLREMVRRIVKEETSKK